jgi:hypothetical protein
VIVLCYVCQPQLFVIPVYYGIGILMEVLEQVYFVLFRI